MTDKQALKLRYGDKVICNTKGRYLITNEKTVCQFIRIATTEDFRYDDRTNEIFILISPIEGAYSNIQFAINSFYFDKIVESPEVIINEDELMNLF